MRPSNKHTSTFPVHRACSSFFAVLLVAIFPAISAASDGPAKVEVGVVLGITGNAAYDASGIRRGLELANAELEQAGRGFKLRVEDDGTETARTLTAFQSLLSQKIHFFIGPTWSYQVNGIRTLAEERDVVLLVPGGSSEINGGSSRSIFNFSLPRPKQLGPVKSWIAENGVKDVAIVTPNGDWGDVHRQVYLDAIAAAGGRVIADEKYDYGAPTSQFVSMLLKVKGRVDSILATGAYGDEVSILRARNQLKLSSVRFLGTELEDAIGLNFISLEETGGNAFVMYLPLEARFEQKYRERYHEPAIVYGQYGYDALMALDQAIRATDGTPGAVRSYLKGSKDLVGASGPIRFDERGDPLEGEYRIDPLATVVRR